MITPEEKKLLELACKRLLEEPKIRFIGIINKMGRLIAEEYKQGVASLLEKQQDMMLHMELALEIFLREEFNEKLGEIDYVHSKRKKINLISIPVDTHIVLVSTDPGVDVDVIAEKVISEFSKLLK